METLRQLIRGMLGYNSAPYRAGATTIDFLVTASKEGITKWRKLRSLKCKARNGQPPHSITLSNLEHSILVRPGTQDAATIINNVVREEYGHFTPIDEPKWMIDAGAYIGDTSAYFLSRFRNLNVIALEPNPESYEMARCNLEPYGHRATLLQMGLFSAEQVNTFSGRGTGAAIARAGVEVDCTTIPALLRDYSIPRIDILKLDIEGAEEAVFASKPEDWLSRIGLIIIEMHGARIESMIARVLNQNGFSMKKYRSLWYCYSR